MDLQPTTYNLQPTRRGFGVIEIVIAVGVIFVALFSIMTVARISHELNRRVLYVTQAGFLLEEGSEGVRAMRDIDWNSISSLSNDTAYSLEFSDNMWRATTTRSLIEGIFDRTIISSAVYRDSSDDIAPSGVVDAGTRKVVINVSWWNGVATSSKNLTLYLTDMFN